MNRKIALIALWVIRVMAALILLQTLFFKFTAAPESVYIFSTIGMEPWGRIATGVLELIASLCILFPTVTIYGSLLALALMTGAILFHLTKLGISVQGDGGQLFIYAVIVFFCSMILVVAEKQNRQIFFRRLNLNMLSQKKQLKNLIDHMTSKASDNREV